MNRAFSSQNPAHPCKQSKDNSLFWGDPVKSEPEWQYPILTDGRLGRGHIPAVKIMRLSPAAAVKSNAPRDFIVKYKGADGKDVSLRRLSMFAALETVAALVSDKHIVKRPITRKDASDNAGDDVSDKDAPALG